MSDIGKILDTLRYRYARLGERRTRRLWRPHPIWEMYEPGYPHREGARYARKTGKFTVPGMVYVQSMTVEGWTVWRHDQ